MSDTSSLNPTSALVIGGSGGLGEAIVRELRARRSYWQVLSLSRRPQESVPSLDYADEKSMQKAAQWVQEQCQNAPLRFVLVATGFLHAEGAAPERSWAELNDQYLQKVMLVNAIGPALTLKYFAPLLPRNTRTQWAMISAKVGSIADNGLGGWYGYRASKAALNQIVKTASIEMTRRNKQSICVALHPGTVATTLSQPFSKTGLNVRAPDVAARELVNVMERLSQKDTGGFFDYQGVSLPW
jgi:NAD(P)-dependent dehydrogenase (short-subunit alcohol dehydrogenase family)